MIPSFTADWRDGWLASSTCHEIATALLAWGATDRTYAGYTRPAAEAPADPDAAPTDIPPLWLLAGRGDHWVLENVSVPDHATYRFIGGLEVPGLVEQLLCAPRFSREALCLPLEELVGEQAVFATAARDLGFLVALRERFRGRAVHRDPTGLRADLEMQK